LCFTELFAQRQWNVANALISLSSFRGTRIMASGAEIWQRGKTKRFHELQQRKKTYKV
jgi:hypothetical protein